MPPRLLIPGNRTCSTVPLCLGTSASQAANSRPDLKALALSIVATADVAVSKPTPEISAMRRLAVSSLCHCLGRRIRRGRRPSHDRGSEIIPSLGGGWVSTLVKFCRVLTLPYPIRVPSPSGRGAGRGDRNQVSQFAVLSPPSLPEGEGGHWPKDLSIALLVISSCKLFTYDCQLLLRK